MNDFWTEAAKLFVGFTIGWNGHVALVAWRDIRRMKRERAARSGGVDR